MKLENRKSVYDDLNKYCCYAKENDYIEVTEWNNREGFDIDVNGKLIRLTYGELEAINYLTKALEIEK